MSSLLTVATVTALATKLRAVTPASRRLTARIEADRIVFEGGAQGAHSLAWDVSSEARVRAHWRGYCENNGILTAVVGDRVTFYSSSAGPRGGMRVGRVAKVGPVRAEVHFRYKYGRESKRSLPLEALTVIR